MTTPRDTEASRSPISSLASETQDQHNRSGALTRPIEAIIEQVGLDKVYGTPVSNGNTTVIPVAELRTGFGYGSGADEQDEGGGGGAGLRMTPRGFIEMNKEGVRYRPIYDLKTLVLGGAVLGWVVARLFGR